MWDYLFDLKSQQSPPRTKSLPVSSIIFVRQLSSYVKIKCSIEIQLFTAWFARHALCEVPTAVRSLLFEHHGHSSTSTTAKFLESQTASQGPYCAFCASGVARLIAPLRHWGDLYTVEHHPHTRLSLGHDSDTN